MKTILTLLTIFTLSACATAPVVSSYNGDSVGIQTTFTGRSAESDAEALRLCKRGGKPKAEYLSTISIPNTYSYEHLYACLTY